jgi:hypothetical protein
MTYSSAMANSAWGIKSDGDDAMVATIIRGAFLTWVIESNRSMGSCALCPQ